MTAPPDLPSAKPYLIRAWHEWCTDHGFTPYVLVSVDHSVDVPREFVQNGEIVLNVGMDATGGMHLGNDCIRFKARFSGRVRDIYVPVERVQAIYARENGQGMGFDVTEVHDAENSSAEAASDHAGTAPVVPGPSALAVVASPEGGVQAQQPEVSPDQSSAGTAAVPADAAKAAGSSGLRIVK